MLHRIYFVAKVIRNRATNKYFDLFIHFYVKNKKEKNRGKNF